MIKEFKSGKVQESTLLEFIEGDPVKTQGCIAFQDNIMDRWFDQMDKMIGVVVDKHFEVAA